MAPYCAQKLVGRCFFLRFMYGKTKISWKYVDSNELKVSWFQRKSFLINRFLWGWKGKAIERRLFSIESLSYQYLFEVFKGKSIESRLISIETLTWVDHPEFPRPGPQENAELLSRLKLFGGGYTNQYPTLSPYPLFTSGAPLEMSPLCHE